MAAQGAVAGRFDSRQAHLAPVPTPRTSTVVFSDREVARLGLARMVQAETGDPAESASSLASLRSALTAETLAVVDLAAEQAREAVTAVAAAGASLLLVTRDSSARVPEQMLELADAVLAADALDQQSVGFAITAASQGLRLIPRELAVPALDATRARRPAPRSLDVIAALADGKRDGEIALELGITESAARKVAQRAVQTIGARTRCQAVAMAVAAGWVA